MADLTQQEADTLIAIEKLFLNPRQVRMPKVGEKKFYNLRDVADKETFNIQVNRGKKNPSKATFNLMYRNNIILVRLDTGHGLHFNPDDTIISANTPHIHIYSEEYGGDSYAYELPKTFSNISDLFDTLFHFFSYSNVINVNEVRIYVQGGFLNEDRV